MRPWNASPVNKTAALTMQKGEHHEIIIGCGNDEWENPPRFFMSEIAGLRNGRIVVVGCLYENKQSKLVCRCDCGRYVYRTSKAMKREKKDPDVCSQCYGLALIKRDDHYRRTGKWTEPQSYL